MRSRITGKKVVQTAGCVLFCLLICGFAFLNRTLGLEPVMQFLRGQSGFVEMKETLTSNYLSNRLRGHSGLITLNGGYTRLLGRTQCNHVQLMNNGMLASVRKGQPDLSAFEDNLVSLNRFLEKEDIPFFYLSAPHKVPTGEQLLPAGVQDRQNQILDQVLSHLEMNHVPCVDLRPEMSSTAGQVESYFYRTDHHWNARGAFYAFQRIMELIQERFPDVKASCAHSDLWENVILPNWWLGSSGRRVGPLFAGTDDLDLCLPRFETDMARYTPGYWAFKGDFRHVNVREWFVENSDYMVLDNYDRYVGGNYPLTYHRNARAENRMNILLIKDSFMMPVECFLSTEFTALDVIDPRGYDQMSIKDYIALNPPDLVIMLCYATSMEQEDFQNFGQDVECTAAEKALWEAPSVSLRGTASDGRDYLSIPLSLEPGKGYRLEMDSVDVLSGLPEGISAVLLRGGEKLDETAFDVDYGNLYGYRWGFYVPDNPSGESACELRLYAGVAENTGGIGLLCSGLRIRECVLSTDQSGAAAASSPAEESSRASITASTGMTHSE